MSGSGTINQLHGITTLSGDSTGFTGTTTVSGGQLLVNGILGGQTGVVNGGALGGTGLAGDVTVSSGGILLGTQGQTLSMGTLTLLAGSNVDVGLGFIGRQGTAGLFNVAGDLTLDGALNVEDLGGFGAGIYRIFDYGGSLIDNGMVIGTTPFGAAPGDLTIQTSVLNQVNLVSTMQGVTLGFWDGPGNPGNGVIEGGSGVWNATNNNWTDKDGAVNGPWSNGEFAVFGGAGGTVTVEAGAGIAVDGMQFAVDGYTIEGDPIELARPETIIRVGTGARNSANMTATIASDLTGTGGLVKTDFGTLILEGNNSYSGNTLIEHGTLRASGTLSGAMDILTSARLEGNLTMGPTSNAGFMAPGGNGQIGTMTINGDYVGHEGFLEIDTVLGDDSSLSDRLVVTGNTSGQTIVHVTNRNGLGANTQEGIRIIEVGGKSDGLFSLAGDYKTSDGQNAVLGGAYAYTLHHNGIATPDDGDWYLRSALIGDGGPEGPRYSAAAPVYEAYPQMLLEMNRMPTLQQRVGNRLWSGNGNRVIAQGADAIGTPYASPEEAGSAIQGNGVWGRIEGAHNRIRSGQSTTGADYDQNIVRLQAGLDAMLSERDSGSLIGGVTVHYAHGSARVSSLYDASTGGGRIGTDGYGLGATLTWYGNNGFYLDGQSQLTWYRSDLSFAGGDKGLVEGNDGFGYGLSIEGGRRIALDPGLGLTPQAQISWSGIRFDSFRDAFRTPVSLDRGESLQGRLGLALDRQTSWTDEGGMTDRASVYGIANLYYEFLEGTRVSVDNASLASRNDRLWGGIGIGGSYNWNDDKYAISGEGALRTSLNSFADNYTISANVTFKAKW
jgi:fibronectin-binding autotransporter adhesin